MKPASAETHRQSRRHSLRKEPGASRSGQWTRDEPAEPSGAHQKTIRVDHPVGTAAINRSRIHSVAMGLAFALILVVADPPGIATLLKHGGSQAISGFVGTIVLTFGIGATLTGVVFIMTEND